MSRYRLSYRLIFFVFLAVFVLSLLPILAISVYAVPCADDYSYGTAVHLTYEDTHSVAAAVGEAFREAGRAYRSWQGTFTAIFLMALQPAVFGEQYYFLTTVIMLASLTAGSFCFCFAFFTGIFRLEKSVSGIIAVVLSTACIQLVLSPAQAFFWYNGSIYYTFFHGLMLMTLALGIRAVQKQGIWRWALLCLMCAMLGGGNYVTALSLAIIGAFAELFMVLKKDRNRFRLLVPMAFFLAAFIVSMTAPGNAVRQAALDYTPNVAKAVINSFKDGVIHSVRWMSWPLFGALVFLVPVFWSCAGRLDFGFKYPALITLLSYCLMSAMFCPSLYATGSEGDFRLLNIIFYSYVLLLIINCFYWTGWAAVRRQHKGERGGLPLRPMLAGCAVLLVCCGLHIHSNAFTSIMSAGAIRSGEAQMYYDCARRRFEILKDDSIRDAVLERYPCIPYVLYFSDISSDPSYWKNTDAAAYYGKNSVMLADLPSD